MISICPKCDEPLLVLSFRGVDLDFCNYCRGLWLDAGELRQILEKSGDEPDDLLEALYSLPGIVPSGKKHLCPRCDESLIEIAPQVAGGAPVTLDRCPRGHGIWFDANELQEVLTRAPSRSGARHTVEFLNDVFGTTLKT